MRDEVKQKIETTLETTRRWWAIGMVLAFAFTLFTQPLWFLLFLIPLAVISYRSIHTFALLYLAAALKEEIAAGALDEEVEEEPPELFGTFSPEIVGIFDGRNMYEWVQIVNPATKVAEKFFYYSPARYDKDGHPLISDEEMAAHRFAHVDGVFYAHDKETNAEPELIVA